LNTILIPFLSQPAALAKRKSKEQSRDSLTMAEGIKTNV
jgi:hypothetical protein